MRKSCPPRPRNRRTVASPRPGRLVHQPPGVDSLMAFCRTFAESRWCMRRICRLGILTGVALFLVSGFPYPGGNSAHVALGGEGATVPLPARCKDYLKTARTKLLAVW